MIYQLKSEEGFSTLIFLSLLLMLSLLGVNAILTSTTEVDIAGYELNTTKALYAAEAGLEIASAQLTNYYNKYGVPPSEYPEDSIQLGRFSVTYSTTKNDSTVSKILTSGAYKGLYALTDEYTVEATATTPGVKARTTLKVTVDASVVPIYQFAVFYEDDLEIAPGPNMTIGGRVHSNNDMYLQSGNNLWIDSYTTAAGSIYHGRSPASGSGDSYGNVFIKDKDGNYQNMENTDGTWLDCQDPDWVAESISRWGGLVEDSDHGMTELKLPVVASGDPVDMIHGSNGGANEDSYENKACLKIVDGTAKYRSSAADSTWVECTQELIDEGILVMGSFTDGREGKTVVSYDLDISELNDSEYSPDNGILYTNNGSGNTGSSIAATRLINGDYISDPVGLTVASADPVYTLGDYNTNQKKPASIMTDAYTVLSNDWDDGASSGILSGRIATNTQVNCAYMTGNKKSGSGGGTSYSGGFENLPRFLENWSSKTFTWVGSAVDLWESEVATGYWSYGSYYTAPNRDWIFDLSFLDPSNLPPGTPLISVVQKTTWHEYIAYSDDTDD